MSACPYLLIILRGGPPDAAGGFNCGSLELLPVLLMFLRDEDALETPEGATGVLIAALITPLPCLAE